MYPLHDEQVIVAGAEHVLRVGESEAGEAKISASPLSTKDSDGAADLDAALHGPTQLAADR